MSHEFLALIETDQDGYLVASVPGIKGCHTQAKTMPELLKRLREVIALCVKADKKIPKHLDFVGIQKIKVAV